jgi:putative long chain acyl-CoA synthase
VTPIHHPTGILVCVGGALAGGARLAVATEFAPATFWDEVRRYGASVVFYTGAMLGELVYAPRDPAERHHPVRLFAGSGMPRPIWQRVLDRFGPLDVVEFWASTEGNAILANLEGNKVGSVGRPLPGSAEVAVVEIDPMNGRVSLGPDGFARRTRDDEIGLLLVRVDRERGALEGRPLRGVFDPGDAWRTTGELFRRDRDGDHWRADSLADAIDAAEGKLPTIPIEDALGVIDAVELAVVYGCRLAGAEKEVPIAAVRLRRSAVLDADEATRAALALDPASRPRFVRIVERIPMTAGFRPVKEPLRAEGIDRDRHAGRLFELNLSSERYRRIGGES